jgi:DNA-binding beta-propeller fold protein YncE
MSVKPRIICAVVVSVVLVIHLSAPTVQLTRSAVSQSMTSGRDEVAPVRLPLQFEINEGQADPAAKFLAHGRGFNLFLASDEVLLALPAPAPGHPPAVLRMQFVGAAPEPQMAGLGQLPGVVNYYLGRDPSRWHAGISTYSKVRYQGIYPGVDLLFFGNEGQLEHDFAVAPGGDPNAIRLRVQGADALKIDRTGDLVLDVAGGELRLLKPFIYQEVAGERQPIEGGYVLRGESEFGFHVSAYDASQVLIIDPILNYSTYFGGSSDDYGYGIAVDAVGSVYITGATNSTDFPLMNPAQPGFGGGGVDCPSDEVPYRLCYDAFVTKLNASGTALVYSTYLGLPGDDEGRGIAVDSAGNAYITGLISIDSESLPGMYIYKYAQLARLDPTGAVTYWLLFGSIDSKGLAVAADSAGLAYVTGEVPCSDFPTTAGAIQTQREELLDAFVSVIDTTTNELVYSTYLGGDGTYCEMCYSAGKGIAVDGAGKIYVTGQAAASFPTTDNAYQRTFDGLWKAFVAKIDPTQSGMAGLVYSTYLGGTTLSDFGYDIALDADGKVYVTGATQTDDFPTTAGAFDRTCGTDGICNTTDNMVCDYVLPGLPPSCHVDAKSDVFVAKLDLSQSPLLHLCRRRRARIGLWYRRRSGRQRVRDRQDGVPQLSVGQSTAGHHRREPGRFCAQAERGRFRPGLFDFLRWGC